jgi:hypothetical protein
MTLRADASRGAVVGPSASGRARNVILLGRPRAAKTWTARSGAPKGR